MTTHNDVATGTLEIVSGGMRYRFDVAIAPAAGPIDVESTLRALYDAHMADEACAVCITVNGSLVGTLP